MLVVNEPDLRLIGRCYVNVLVLMLTLKNIRVKRFDPVLFAYPVLDCLRRLVNLYRNCQEKVNKS